MHRPSPNTSWRATPPAEAKSESAFRPALNLPESARDVSHDAGSGIQPQSRSLANSFGREKWLKDVRQNLIWNSRTIICNLHHYARVLTIGAEAEFALPAHRVNCIVNNVGPDLIQLTTKRIHQKR